MFVNMKLSMVLSTETRLLLELAQSPRWRKAIREVNFYLQWKDFLNDCNQRHLTPHEAQPDDKFWACTLEREKGHAHVICPKQPSEKNLIEVHIFYDNHMHGMFTHSSLEKLPTLIAQFLKYAKTHPQLMRQETLYPDAYDHTDPFMKTFHSVDWRPLNADDWPK